MNVKYKLKEQDYIDFNLYHMAHSKLMKSHLMKQRIAGPIIFTVAAFITPQISGIPFWYWATVFSIVSILWFFNYPKLSKKRMRKQISKMLSEGDNKDFFSLKELTLEKQGIIIKSPFSETSVLWPSFGKLATTKSHIFIYNGAASAYIIPKRAFSSDEAYNFFLQALEKHIKL